MERSYTFYLMILENKTKYMMLNTNLIKNNNELHKNYRFLHKQIHAPFLKTATRIRMRSFECLLYFPKIILKTAFTKRFN